MVKRFLDWLALTGTERKVLLFLASSLAVGSSIRVYQSLHPSSPVFDYARSDSIFVARSAMVPGVLDSTTAREMPAGPLDINAATKEQLVQLPGIGDVTAERLIAYRTQHGRFRSVDELSKVKGFSRSKINKLRPQITAGTKTKGDRSP